MTEHADPRSSHPTGGEHPASLIGNRASEILKGIEDFYLPDSEPYKGSVFPGPKIVPEELRAFVLALADQSRAHYQQKGVRDFRMTLEGITFRVHLQETVAGLYHVMRRVRHDIAPLESLGLPPPIREAILSKALLGGGLVLLSGRNGHGKTTTCCSSIVARLQTYGGICMTLEDPVEKPMQGWYRGEDGVIGQCIQCPVEGGDFAPAIRDAMRLFPSQQRSSMLLVGEIRDSETAAQVIRASINGQLVFTTLHSLSLLSALERIVAMADNVIDAKTLLGTALRLALHQKIENGRLTLQVLYSPNENSRVAAGIKGNKIQNLSTEIEQQLRHIELGRSLTTSLN